MIKIALIVVKYLTQIYVIVAFTTNSNDLKSKIIQVKIIILIDLNLTRKRYFCTVNKLKWIKK